MYYYNHLLCAHNASLTYFLSLGLNVKGDAWQWVRLVTEIA